MMRDNAGSPVSCPRLTSAARAASVCSFATAIRTPDTPACCSKRPVRRGKRLRLYYAAQIGRRPPRIAIQVNDRQLITRDWAYFLENRLREHYALEGVPLVIDFIPHSRRGDDRPRPGRRAL